jgi:XTP/dITP diphosphohydrolase
LIAVGRLSGEITESPKGQHGFGFDPVMYIAQLGATLAELDPAHKNRLSHRGQAAQKMLILMKDNWL